MRALVTGAAGFVGRHLVGHLESMGDTVIAVDRHDGPDLLDATALDAFVADVAPEAIYHLAGWSDIGGSWHEPAEHVPSRTRRDAQPAPGLPVPSRPECCR